MLITVKNSKCKLGVSGCHLAIIITVICGIIIFVGLIAGLMSKNSTTDSNENLTEATPTLLPVDGPWNDPFLPRNVIPEHYDIWLFPDFYFDGTNFTGKENITLRVNESTKYILLQINDMRISDTKLYNATGDEVALVQSIVYTYQYWVVEAQNELSVGKYVLHLEFAGTLDGPIMFVGYYKSTYINSITGKESWLATTKFQPIYARNAFPNWDEPRFKAQFNITLRHWQNFTAISNMPEYAHVDDGAIWRETMFEKTPIMSSYLICFIVFNFVSKQNTLSNGKTNKIWAPVDRINSVDFALNYTKQVQDYLEQELDMEFHLPKLDNVAVPDYSSGATEHWGIITYRESNLLYDPAVAGPEDEQNVASIVAHEVSHHYFGNPVTCEWWDDIWLNEGFANFYEQKALELIPKYEARDDFVLTNHQSVLRHDARADSRPLVKEITDPSRPYRAFTTIAYKKGASLLRMMEDFIGTETFRDAIRVYLKENEYGSVTTAKFYNTLARETGIDIPTIMDPWTYQMGFPLITVTEANNEITLTQKRFLSDPEADPDWPTSSYGYQWYVPMSYITQGGIEGRKWVNNATVTYTDPRDDPATEWIIINRKQMGFFRVNYSPDMWSKLAAQLMENHLEINVADRCMILDDAFTLARATQLDFLVALNLTKYLDKEEHYFPWKVITRGLDYIGVMMYNTGSYSMWRKYIQNITRPIMNKLEVEGSLSHLDRLNRNEIITLACGHGNVECLTNVTELFSEWLDNQTATVDPEIRRVVYQYGMFQMSGVEGVWDEVLDRYEKEGSMSEKNDLMFTLAQTDKQWLIYKYLDYASTEGNFTKGDFHTVIRYLAKNPAANRYLWDWTRDNFSKLIARSYYLETDVLGMVKGYNTEFQLSEVESFYNQNPRIDSARGKALTSINRNIAWMKLNIDLIVTWLTDYLE